MANTDNQCSKLEIKDEYSKSDSHLKDIFDCQLDTQNNVYNWHFSEMTLRELKDYWHLNNHSFIDEIHEAMDALGGINDGIGNAVWKPWKSDHSKIDDLHFKDLSEADQLEAKFEVVDMLHFFINYALSIGMTPEEMYNMYMSKNEENRNRQKNGY